MIDLWHFIIAGSTALLLVGAAALVRTRIAQARLLPAARYLPGLPSPGVQQAQRMSVRCSAARRFGANPARFGVGSPARRHRR